MAAKKRTSDSKKLIRLSDSAADRQQLNSHFFVVYMCVCVCVCVFFSLDTCPGVIYICFSNGFLFFTVYLFVLRHTVRTETGSK